MGARWKTFVLLTLPLVLYVTGLSPVAATRFSEWSTPALVPGVNSAFTDLGPGISKDGLSLYFGSDRPGGIGGADLWVSQRASTADAWGPPVNLGATINTSAQELVPAFSRDGHWMFFNSSRPGGHGGLDVWVSFRRHTHDDFAWTTPVNLGTLINASGLDAGASYFQNDGRGADEALLFFGSDRPGGLGEVDLYVSTGTSNTGFGPPVLLSELNTPFSEQRPTVRYDGLEVVFYSDRPGGMGATDLWVATRETLAQAWSTPVNLGSTINSTSLDFHPYLSADGRSLYFASARSGGVGLADLYVTERTNRKD